MTVTAVLFPIMAAISVAQEKLSIKQWAGITAQQQIFLDQFYNKRTEMSNFLPSELFSCSSHNYDEVNRFLKDHGFSIQLEKSKDTRDLAVASILDIALTWKQPGTRASLLREEETGVTHYNAIRMRSGYTIRKFSGSSDSFILEIEATNNDKVYLVSSSLVKKEISDFNDFELITYLKSLSAREFEDYTDYFADALFPMIEIDQHVDISWLLGLDGGNYFIRQALQQTKFAMNENGARVQSGVAVEAAFRSMPTRPSLIFDKPFYLWIERPGMSIPLLAAYVDTDCWVKSTISA